MRQCDICGTFNFKENNYCIHCGNKLEEDHICPYCGASNDNFATHCVNCSSQINPIFIDNFDTLFSDYNLRLLAEAEISDAEYNDLLKDIFIRADHVEVYGKTTKDMILSLAKVFTECKPKSRGFERGYIFLDNCIYYDDRLDDSVQIATIIHELGHYFLFSIIEKLLCHVFKVHTSSTLQSFIWFFLTLPEFKIMNEYCAHTVEGRFIPYGYQNYGSFNALVKQIGIGEASLNDMIVLGNSFANEIIVYLEKYINIGLRADIKVQYRKDLVQPNYESILLETNDAFPLDIKNRVILNVLLDVFREVSDEKSRIELENIKDGINLK